MQVIWRNVKLLLTLMVSFVGGDVVFVSVLFVFVYRSIIESEETVG